MTIPNNPRFSEHMHSLDLLRRFVIFSDDASREGIQESLAEIVAAMKGDGYARPAIRLMLRCAGALVAQDAHRFRCDEARIRYFFELLRIEIEL